MSFAVRVPTGHAQCWRWTAQTSGAPISARTRPARGCPPATFRGWAHLARTLTPSYENNENPEHREH